MSQHKAKLPQLDGGLFLTDGGIETTLIFHDGLDLPHFAAFHLLKDDAGTAALRRYFARHAGIAPGSGVSVRPSSAAFIVKVKSSTQRRKKRKGRKEKQKPLYARSQELTSITMHERIAGCLVTRVPLRPLRLCVGLCSSYPIIAAACRYHCAR